MNETEYTYQMKRIKKNIEEIEEQLRITEKKIEECRTYLDLTARNRKKFDSFMEKNKGYSRKIVGLNQLKVLKGIWKYITGILSGTSYIVAKGKLDGLYNMIKLEQNKYKIEQEELKRKIRQYSTQYQILNKEYKQFKK